MGYFLNSILVKNETDFEKIEQLYHSMVYTDYESSKRKTRGKIYDTVSIKYFPITQSSSICIYDENNIEIPSIAKKLSCELNNDVISIQVFDSDELKVQAFRKGTEITSISKNHQEYKIEGEVTCLYPDKEECISILKENYTFMEDCAEKLFPKELVFPEERIPNQKIVKYTKEISIPLENKKLPEFETYGCGRITKVSKQFNFEIINYGKKSKGLLVLLRGSAIENKYVKVLKAYVNTGFFRSQEDSILCAEPEIKKNNGETYLIYRFVDFEFPAGYNKESLDTLFKSNNLSLYKKGLDYMLESAITIYFDCEVSETKGEIEAVAYPYENIKNNYAYCQIEISD